MAKKKIKRHAIKIFESIDFHRILYNARKKKKVTTENETKNKPNHSRYYQTVNDEHNTGVNN